MTLQLHEIEDPTPGGFPTEVRPAQGHWYQIELDVLKQWFALLGAEELSLNWIPEFSAAEIEAKAREIGLD